MNSMRAQKLNDFNGRFPDRHSGLPATKKRPGISPEAPFDEAAR
jgi:hypothetical protein